MLILKYAKVGDAKYISHVDTLRVLTRSLRRMGIKVEYSKGFNPHMLLNMSPPLPVGMESQTEFVEIATDCGLAGFIEKFDSCCPAGFSAVQLFYAEKSPRITAITTAAEYRAGEHIFIIPCGNKNLRADKYLTDKGIDPRQLKITRTRLFTGEENKLVLIDDVINGQGK